MQLSFPGMPPPDATMQKRKPRYRIQPQPVCPVHGVPMLVGSTRKRARYCYCPVEGCHQSAKQSRISRGEFEANLDSQKSPGLVI